MIAQTSPVSCSVVICAYTDRRWDQLVLGYRVTVSQLRAGDQLIVVIDHNDQLEQQARRELDGALVITNVGDAGLSGARNSGVSRATGEVVVFLDDDACPNPGWLDAYRATFRHPSVQVVSGAVDPVWAGESAPRWFPPEFGWVVGCDYRGLPADGSRVRNPIGANMAIRRTSLEKVGGFSVDVGRIGTLPMGCEETDLCIRLRQADPSAVMLRNTAAGVRHAVSADRRRLRYFLSRCYYEGRSKAVLAARVGAEDGLSSERHYVTKTLSTGVLRGFGSVVSGQLLGPLRSAAIVAGLTATAFGFARGRWRQPDAAPAASSPWLPLVMSEYRLDDPNQRVVATSNSRTRLLVTSAGSPLGFVDLAPSEQIPTPEQISEQLSSDQSAIGPAAGAFTGSAAFTPRVSVVVPTRGRSFELVRCIRSVLAVDYPDFEVLVVDNNDRAGSVDELLAPLRHDARLRVLHLGERGASRARNMGIVEASADIIAATDDDVVVSPTWLRELVAPFSDPQITCVCGLVVPDGFSSPAQEMFEQYGGFSKGFRAVRYDLGAHRADHVLYPYSAGIYGSGNNVAYRRSAVMAFGGYDLRLGPGTPARAGEDLDLFLNVLFAGGAIYYQPRAWVKHHHRDSLEALRKQLRDYGRGLSAVMLTWALSSPRRAGDIGRRLPAGLRHLLDPRSDKNKGRSTNYPAKLYRSELRGMLEGACIVAYDRIGRRTGRGGRRAPLRQPPAASLREHKVSHHV